MFQLEELEYCQKTKKEQFNKEIMTAEDEENFKNENKCHIYNEEYTKKLIHQNVIVVRKAILVKDTLVNKKFGYVLHTKYIAILVKM